MHPNRMEEIMFASIHSATVVGVDALPVMVEVDVGAGLQKAQPVGLPEGAVRESRVRVHSAMENAGSLFPAGQANVNLAPADIRKEGDRKSTRLNSSHVAIS